MREYKKQVIIELSLLVVSIVSIIIRLSLWARRGGRLSQPYLDGGASLDDLPY